MRPCPCVGSFIRSYKSLVLVRACIHACVCLFVCLRRHAFDRVLVRYSSLCLSVRLEMRHAFDRVFV